jgi:predicted RNA binding protein YcfA (HicA-like mRNA interferase family)
MSKKSKLLLRFLCRPKDFTFDEAVKLLRDFGFYEVTTGMTAGSRVRFRNEDYPVNIIKFHKPHPDNIIKPYILDIIINNLEECNLLTDIKKQNDEQDFEA